MVRLTIRLSAIALLLLASRTFAAADAPPQSQDAEPLAIVHGPYLHAPRSDSMTVVWFTNQKCVSWVEYGEDANLSKKAQSSHFGLIDAFNTRHAIQLHGLEPGKTYHYRVVSKAIAKYDSYRVDFGQEVAGKTFQFQTCDAKKENFSFCVASDIHEQARQLDGLLQGIRWQGVDFVVFDGDMVSDFYKDSQVFEGFLDVCVSRFASNTPMLYVRGNHETRGMHARRLIDFAPVPEGRFYYSFNHGGVHFIVMDSGEDKEDSDGEYGGLVDFDAYRQEQARWLQEDIRSEASRKATFRIALFHMPVVDPAPRHGIAHIKKLWLPLLNEAGVDLVICGHTHRANHVPAAKGENCFDMAVCSPTSVVRVDVDPKRLSVAWQGLSGGEKLPETFTRDASQQSDPAEK
jgi:acid phosphatase type 7